MKNKINQIILDVLDELGESQDNQNLIDANENTRLFGENLDSMGVVFLVTDLEAAISDEYDVNLTLADERAMSQKTSPFRTVKTLSKYVEQLIADQLED